MTVKKNQNLSKVIKSGSNPTSRQKHEGRIKLYQEADESAPPGENARVRRQSFAGSTEDVATCFEPKTPAAETSVKPTSTDVKQRPHRERLGGEHFITGGAAVSAYTSMPRQRKESELKLDEELKEAEQAVEEAKKKLQEEMEELETRMAARRERLQERYKILNTEQTTLTGQNSSQNSPPVIAAPPTRFTDPAQATQSTSPQAVLQQHPTWPKKMSDSFTRNTIPDCFDADSRQSTQGDYQASHLAQEITEHMHVSLLAPAEPNVFSGDPLEYADWRVAFDSLIDSERGSPIEKLHRLKKYVSGNAKEAICGYFRLQTKGAYEEALATLHEEFGREDLVENSFRDKLESWPRIANKDHDALKKYSYFLKQCLAAQRVMPNLQALNDKRENKKYIKVLPAWLVNRWTYYVTDKEEKKGFPPFSKYVEFISHEARVSSNNLRDTEDAQPHPKPTPPKRERVRNLRLSPSKPSDCTHCQKGTHPVAECRSLAAKSEPEKERFIKENRLCYGCLKFNHLSKACQNRATCTKCGKRHPTVLHKDFQTTQETSSKTETGASRAKPTTEKPNGETKKNVHTVKQRKGSNLLNMIVPVYVSSDKSEQLVYALLDTQFDASFITSSLASQIDPSYTTEKITMATLHGETTQRLNRYTISVRGYGLQDAQRVEVRAYEQSTLPCNRNQIPNKKHVSDIPHLKHLQQEIPPEMDIPVGILIGVDCATALAPREVILGEEGETFAMRTVFG
ncbi:uncharacterized protein [Watersipora subatra]|uniref:uncharacterized protein n=1 Tax=Watersipora subatra TaxID=2589382 RepID=UPI00355B97F6